MAKNIIELIQDYITDNYKIRRNLISRNIEVDNRPLTDIDLNSIFIKCKLNVKGSVTKELVFSLIFSDFIQSYNPFTDFINNHIQSRPTGNLLRLIKSIETDTENHDVFITKWLMSVQATIDGKHSPLMLVLLGDQNTGKTEWFRRLLPTELQPYYAEDKLDQGKDSEILMTKKLIIMDDEMGGKSKAESKVLNRLTSSQTFSIREPYGKVSTDLNRLAMLCGTTNYEGILNDSTGNRRILPIKVVTVKQELYNSINKTDLFIECYNLYKEGVRYNLNSDEIKTLNASTEQFRAISPEEDMIQKYCRKPLPNDEQETAFMTPTELVSRIKKETQIILIPQKIGTILKSLGYEKCIKRVEGCNYPVHGWKVVFSFYPVNPKQEKDMLSLYN